MAVDGESLKEEEFFDPDSGRDVKVTLKVRDIIFFRLLSDITKAIKRLK